MNELLTSNKKTEKGNQPYFMTASMNKDLDHDKLMKGIYFLINILNNLYSKRFESYWNLFKLHLEKTSFSESEVKNIQSNIYQIFLQNIEEIMMKEINVSLNLLYSNSNYGFLSGRISSESYVITEQKDEYKINAFLKMAKKYSKNRIPEIIEDAFYLPQSQIELSMNMLDTYNDMKEKVKKFSREKYPEKVFNKANEFYNGKITAKGYTLEKALMDSLRTFPEYEDVLFDINKLYLWYAAYRQRRSRPIRKKNKKKKK
jgi:hypothetical protein